MRRLPSRTLQSIHVSWWWQVGRSGRIRRWSRQSPHSTDGGAPHRRGYRQRHPLPACAGRRLPDRRRCSPGDGGPAGNRASSRPTQARGDSGCRRNRPVRDGPSHCLVPLRLCRILVDARLRRPVGLFLYILLEFEPFVLPHTPIGNAVDDSHGVNLWQVAPAASRRSFCQRLYSVDG
jgi:hypothetical protein